MYCHCGKISENKDTGECASCGAARRKAERMHVKDKTPINKVSEKHGKDLKQYAWLRKRFLLNAWCAYHGRPCVPDEIHHQMGRVGFADDKCIPLLIDVRYFIPVCREAHEWITQHTKEAIEQGFSYSRITKEIRKQKL